MTDPSEATGPPRAAPSDTSETESPAPAGSIPLRLGLLILLLALANFWFLLMFGMKIGSLVVVEILVAVAAGLRKLLRPNDSKAVDRLIQRLFYAMLSTPFLVIGYALLIAVTLMTSTVTISGAEAKKTCIKADGTADCIDGPLFSDEKKAIFLARTGKAYNAILNESEARPVPVRPWRPETVETNEFSYSPSVLIRVPYPHGDIEGGVIDVRESGTSHVLASAKTSAESASLLLGRKVTIAAPLAGWSDEVRGADPSEAQRALARWRNFARPDRDLPIAKGSDYQVVFRTERQAESTDANDVTASAPLHIEGGTSVQEVVLIRRPNV